jgi:hypothetical protein
LFKLLRRGRLKPPHFTVDANMFAAFRGRLRPVLVPCIPIFAAAAANATATTCGDLEGERSRLSTEMLHLVANYPGTHAMLGGCAATASDNYQRTKDSNGAAGTFFLCAAVGCAFVGLDNCSAISKEWFVLYGQNEQLTTRMRAAGCPV